LHSWLVILVCPQTAGGNAKTNANLNAGSLVNSTVIIRVAPLFAGEVSFFGFAATRRKSKRLVQGRANGLFLDAPTRAVQEG
jgi:hypothetical protein